MESLDRARNSIKNARAETEAIAERSVNLALSAGSGFVLGYLDKKHGKLSPGLGLKTARVPGTDIELDAAIAGVGGLLGASGLAGEMSDEICAVASAAGAVATWKLGYEKTDAPKK
jgi:hypothetical protein